MRTKPASEAGTWLRRVRDYLGLSRKALAAASGLTPSTIRNIENSRHRPTRHTAALLLQAIANRDLFLAQTAPSSLRAAMPVPDSESEPEALARSPLAHLRFRPIGPRRALVQIELDPLAVRQLLSALGELLARGERLPRVDLPGLHLVLVEKS
jgi:transcriptional regulator with XRE-family HTH domain